MNAFSGHEIKALGKRLKAGEPDRADIEMLDQYRHGFDPLLFKVATVAEDALHNAGISNVAAGRAKRTKSIIRKLKREQNRGMDLSRVSDIAGLRIVVRDMADQQHCLDVLELAFSGSIVLDYRAPERRYRAVHLVIVEEGGFRRVEIQIRTLQQQLWANESESFGEEAKAGGGPTEVQEYLNELASLCAASELGQVPPEPDAGLFAIRAPLTFRLPLLRGLFQQAIEGGGSIGAGTTFVVVYDNQMNTLNQRFRYEKNERDAAIKDFMSLTRRNDESRYETLLLNTDREECMQVTHQRFFPEPDIALGRHK